ncbi:hypothetical protein QYE76_021980 [Lolium multiflorum]|uniref:GRF-type domain-containing protein n=1 Tax=Lolium multiflorum TaxID=4521 RepID=A0AAD8R7I3_LOLMU|nr:hypothetical protein QYE76_021980 [Lolium multiflorum]
MSSSSSRATSRFELPVRMEMPILLCPRCRAAVDRRILRTSNNTNRPFYVCSSEKGIKCFFVWVDVLVQTLMNQLLDEHEEWLPILPQMTRVAAIASAEETEGGARIDREVVLSSH